MSKGDRRDQMERAPLEFDPGQAFADELVVTAGAMECSIVASDVRAATVNRCKDGSDTDEVTLLQVEEGFRDDETRMRWLSEDFTTEAGYEVRLGLVAEDAKKRRLSRKKDLDPTAMQIVAVTRGNIAFPVVTFREGNSAFCPFMQFWGENEMDELDSTNFYGWSQDDNGSRFEAVQAVGRLVDHGEGAEELADTLKFDKILSSRLGESDPETEEIIRDIFRLRLDKDDDGHDTRTELEHVFEGVTMGRAQTQMTVHAIVEEIDSKSLRRKITLNGHPTNQPGEDWRTVTMLADKTTGLTLVDEDGSARKPSSAQLAILNMLVGCTVDSQRSRELGGSSSREGDAFLQQYTKHPTILLAGYTAVNFTIRLGVTQDLGSALFFGPTAGAISTGILVGLAALDRGKLRRD